MEEMEGKGKGLQKEKQAVSYASVPKKCRSVKKLP
jgi:hypothetical protein